MKRISIITSKYPNKYAPSALVFVQQLAWTIADLGLECNVICPVAYNIDVVQGIKLPLRTVETTNKGSKIELFFPRYFGFGQQDLRIMNTAKFTLETFTKAVRSVMMAFEEKPDVVYGHFITPSGITAARMGQELEIPSFVAYGESSPWSITNIGLNKAKKELEAITGVISVSTHNKNELIRLDVVDADKIGVFPNAIRQDHFYPRNKIESRKKFGLPLDSFIVAFVGHFINRKGIDKVIESVNRVDGVYAIYAGKGPISPDGEKTLYSGVVNPSDLPWFYSAADVFVLPTLNEGCCNAIIEAMACGLPIISSNLPFNDDILDKSCSIRINPTNVDEIEIAIRTVYNDRKKLQDLSKGSLQKSKNFTLESRAKLIIDFMNRKSCSEDLKNA